MSKAVDYYMTPVSPFTYLGHERLKQICAKRGAEIRLKLMDLGKVFPASGGLALKDRAPQRKVTVRFIGCLEPATSGRLLGSRWRPVQTESGHS